MLASGVCGHDLADRAGLAHVDLPVVLGHEVAGEVVEIGSAVRRFRVGDLVAGKQFTTCGSCLHCRSGDELRCERKAFCYGGYAEFVALEQDTLLPIPQGVSPEAAAVTACAVGSCQQALERIADLRHGENVLVTGAGGGLGLHGMQVARAMGARVIGLTSSPAKATQLLEFGADEVVISSALMHDEVLELTGGKGVDVVLDNVGHPDVFTGAFRALAHRGRYVLTGQLYRQKVSFHPAFVLRSEAVITGSGSTLMSTFMRSMDLVASGKVQAVTREFPLSEAAAVHTAMETNQILGRAVLTPPS